MAIVASVGQWVHDMLIIPLRYLGRAYPDGSFGAGFLGYRADLGWPRGVQEDDDTRWTWTATSASRADEAPLPELSPVIGHTRPRR